MLPSFLPREQRALNGRNVVANSCAESDERNQAALPSIFAQEENAHTDQSRKLVLVDEQLRLDGRLRL